MRNVVRPHTRGQTLVELSLVMPLFVMLLTGIIVLGIGLFYQQQLANAAREGARYAAVHSATSDCPTMSTLDPLGSMRPQSYKEFCDRHETSWPRMSAHVRDRLAGLNASQVRISACWSGYISDTGQYDAPPPGTHTNPVTGIVEPVYSTWAPCTIDGQDPSESSAQIGCGPSLPTSDTASNASESESINVANRVTVYTCYRWVPPLAGFLLLPDEVILRAVSTEAIQRQQ